jgi:dUTP pyrophosphatase
MVANIFFGSLAGLVTFLLTWKIIKPNRDKFLLKITDKSLVKYYKEKEQMVQSRKNDSGLDLPFPKDLVIKPKSTQKIDLGLCIQPTFKSGYYLYPRSSISKTPLQMANSVGIIDYGYRGAIIACVRNTQSEPYTIYAGQKLFQLCSPNLTPFDIKLVDELDSSERGIGGFGSTGQ